MARSSSSQIALPIEKRAEAIGASSVVGSVVEMVRRSLVLYDTLVALAREGRKIIVRSPDGTEQDITGLVSRGPDSPAQEQTL